MESHQYSSLREFEADFYHVWHNATIYNQPETIYYKAAIRIRDSGGVHFSIRTVYFLTFDIWSFYNVI